MADIFEIAGRIHSTSQEEVVTTTSEILAGADNKKQSDVNTEVQTALDDRYTKEQTYNKQELDNLITTPDVTYETYRATDETSVTDILPEEGSADTIYRIGNWDGTTEDATKFAEYSWNGSNYVLLRVVDSIGDGVFDISEYNASGGTLATYADLSAALSGTNVPEGVRKGGMSVKFVQTSDNKYVQYFLTKNVWSASEADWQKINLYEEISQLGQDSALYLYGKWDKKIASLSGATTNLEPITFKAGTFRYKVSIDSAVSSPVYLTIKDKDNITIKNIALATGDTIIENTWTNNSEFEGYIQIFTGAYASVSNLEIELEQTEAVNILSNKRENDLHTASFAVLNGIISKTDGLSDTDDSYITIPGLFKAGQKIKVTATLGGGASVPYLSIFQDGSNTSIDVVPGVEKEITLPRDSRNIQLYANRNIVVSAGNYTFTVKGSVPLLDEKVTTLTSSVSSISGTVTIIGNDVTAIKTLLDYSQLSGSVEVGQTGKYVYNNGSLATNADYNISTVMTLPKNTKIVFSALGVANTTAVLAAVAETTYTPLVIADQTSYKEYTYINETGADLSVVISYHKSYTPPYTITDYGVLAEIGDLDNLTTQNKSTLVAAINELNQNNNTPTLFDGGDIGIFNKGLCIGDSLTAGTFNYYEDGSTLHYIDIPKYSYPSKLKEMMGIDITNLGEGGATSAEWYSTHSSDDLSGYDFAIIQLGVNDKSRYGGWTQTSIDAFTNIINKLRNENHNIKIFVATIIPATSYSGREDISAGIRTLVANLNDPNVILLDMAVYGNVGQSDAYNCGHLSAYGYWRLAKDYYNYISWYIYNNKGVFREVQFIGTNYQYEIAETPN